MNCKHCGAPTTDFTGEEKYDKSLHNAWKTTAESRLIEIQLLKKLIGAPTEHIVSGEHCWCDPEVIDGVIVHRRTDN